MNLIGPRKNSRYYFVPQDGSLFKVQGSVMRASFNELRDKTPELIFKCVLRSQVNHLRGTGQVSREVELISPAR